MSDEKIETASWLVRWLSSLPQWEQIAAGVGGVAAFAMTLIGPPLRAFRRQRRLEMEEQMTAFEQDHAPRPLPAPAKALSRPRITPPPPPPVPSRMARSVEATRADVASLRNEVDEARAAVQNALELVLSLTKRCESLETRCALLQTQCDVLVRERDLYKRERDELAQRLEKIGKADTDRPPPMPPVAS